MVGPLLALAGAVVTFIGLFSLDWMSISTEQGTGELSRNALAASLADDENVDLDIGLVTDTFFQFGWIVTLVVAIVAIGAALLRQGAVGLLVAGSALACAIWTLVAAIGASGPMEDGVQAVYDMNGSASAQLGVWFTLIGVIVAGAGPIVASGMSHRSR